MLKYAEFEEWRAFLEVRMLVPLLVLVVMIHLARISWKHHNQSAWWNPHSVKAHRLKNANRVLNGLLFLQMTLLVCVVMATLVAVWMSVLIMLTLFLSAAMALYLFFWIDGVRTSRWSAAKIVCKWPYSDTQQVG